MTMPNVVVVERDYVKHYNTFISYGPRAIADEIGFHGIVWRIDGVYEKMCAEKPINWGRNTYPCIAEDVDDLRSVSYTIWSPC